MVGSYDGTPRKESRSGKCRDYRLGHKEMVYFVELLIARIADMGVVVFKRIYQTTLSFQARDTM